jgi:hypothetical protein
MKGEGQKQSEKLVCTSVHMTGEKRFVTTVEKDVAQIWLRQSAGMLLARYGGQCKLGSTVVSSQAKQLRDCAQREQKTFVLKSRTFSRHFKVLEESTSRRDWKLSRASDF